MARRKDHTRDELRALSIEHGTRIIREQGAAALTARKVADAIGYAPGTLYNLFDNLAGLVDEIKANAIHRLAGDMASSTRRCTSPRSKLERICGCYLQLHAADPELCTLLFATPHHAPAESVHAVFGQVTAAIRPIRRTDDLARQDAKIIWSTLHGICLLHHHGKLDVATTESPDTPEQLVQRFLNRFLET